MGIADEDLTLLTEAFTKVVEKTLGNLTSWKTNWIASITTKVNRLVEAVIEVCDTM